VDQGTKTGLKHFKLLARLSTLRIFYPKFPNGSLLHARGSLKSLMVPIEYSTHHWWTCSLTINMVHTVTIHLLLPAQCQPPLKHHYPVLQPSSICLMLRLMDLKLLIRAPYRVNRCTQTVTSPSSRTTSLERVRQSTYSQVTATVPVRSFTYPTYQLDSSFKQAVTKLGSQDIADTGEPASSQPPMLARQPEPVEYYDGRENIILNGNTFGRHVMINIGSQYCTGAGRLLNNRLNIQEFDFLPLTS
jgi:hypothetical protein